MGLRYALQSLGDGRRGVFHGGGVACGGGSENVGPLERVGAGAPQVVERRAGADGRGIHPGEDVQCPRAAFLVGDAGEEAVVLQGADRGHRHAGQRHGPGQAAPEVDAGEHVPGLRVQIADDPAQPALGSDALRLAGVPDVHGPEVRAVGVGVADAVDYRHPPFVVQLLERGQHRVKAVMPVNVQNVLCRYADGGTVFPVERISVRHHGVHIIVAPGQLHDNQDRVALYAGHCPLHPGLCSS